MDAMRALLLTAGIHTKFEMANGEAAIAGLKVLLKLHHDPHTWDDLWRAIAAEHPFRDAWWEDRNLLPLLDRVEVPVYMGCDWQNVPLHLPHTFTAYERLTNSKHVRVAMMGEHGLAWPWESLHIEAIAWFDHWLKGLDSGILDGPHFRYILPEAEGWRTTDAWPIPEALHQLYALRADGGLSEEGGEAGSRTYMNLGGGLDRSISTISAAIPDIISAYAVVEPPNLAPTIAIRGTLGSSDGCVEIFCTGDSISVSRINQYPPRALGQSFGSASCRFFFSGGAESLCNQARFTSSSHGGIKVVIGGIRNFHLDA
jgi:hypothetical protein